MTRHQNNYIHMRKSVPIASTILLSVGFHEAFHLHRFGRYSNLLLRKELSAECKDNISGIQDLRKEYSKIGLLEKELPLDPLDLFDKWFSEARDAAVLEPNAMVNELITHVDNRLSLNHTY